MMRLQSCHFATPANPSHSKVDLLVNSNGLKEDPGKDLLHFFGLRDVDATFLESMSQNFFFY
jgi:hypothetical protein